ncbi:MAG: hypothetical protein RL264_953 [Bacteroidota bacterium]|jgi:hypothetical protein
MHEPQLKKPCYPLTKQVESYLDKYGRIEKLPLDYEALLRYKDAFPVGDTLWISVLYSHEDFDEINKGLCYIYSLLKTEGDISVIEHLRVDRVDYCLFGNSNPFRVKIINNFNDNYDYFYVKKTDLSRVFGLELEDILSPNKINYFIDRNTLIEEHISGIPGDDFLQLEIQHAKTNKTRLAKEFIKFNERCFFTLLGDMRSYNYVIELTHDFDDVQYRIRSIDFDQQCYEGRKKFYLPQFFKENNQLVKLSLEVLNEKSINQYRIEERSRLLRRIKHSQEMLQDLFKTMMNQTLSTPAKIKQLASELAIHHKDDRLKNVKDMASLLSMHLTHLQEKNMI